MRTLHANDLSGLPTMSITNTWVCATPACTSTARGQCEQMRAGDGHHTITRIGLHDAQAGEPAERRQDGAPRPEHETRQPHRRLRGAADRHARMNVAAQRVAAGGSRRMVAAEERWPWMRLAHHVDAPG